jgi:hypothetical protein
MAGCCLKIEKNVREFMPRATIMFTRRCLDVRTKHRVWIQLAYFPFIAARQFRHCSVTTGASSVEWDSLNLT